MTILAPEVMDPIHTVKPTDSQTLMVSFSLKTGATHYIIRVQNANGFFREDTVSSFPVEIKSLTPYTEYTLSIMAVNSGGRSQPSLPVTAKTGMDVSQYNERIKHSMSDFCKEMSHADTENPLVLFLSTHMPCRSHLISL